MPSPTADALLLGTHIIYEGCSPDAGGGGQMFFRADRGLITYVCAAGADPESAADSHHQHLGYKRNHRLLPALLLQIQGLQ